MRAASETQHFSAKNHWNSETKRWDKDCSFSSVIVVAIALVEVEVVDGSHIYILKLFGKKPETHTQATYFQVVHLHEFRIYGELRSGRRYICIHLILIAL